MSGINAAVATRQPAQAKQPDNDEGEVSQDIQSVGNTEHRALIGELMIGRILRDRWHQEDGAGAGQRDQ